MSLEKSFEEARNPLRRLELPRRWELLAQRAAAANIDPAIVVERVDDAAQRVDVLLGRVRDHGSGVIEVFFGLSGSGKTTFLQTLPRFFNGITVSVFPHSRPLSDLPAFILSSHPVDDKNHVVLIDRRDNPTKKELEDVEEVFSDLLNAFRDPRGGSVVLWPITHPDSARRVAELAWLVGRDSMADSKSGGQFHFKGVDRKQYWSLADNTSRTLTGDGLEGFGITQQFVQDKLPACETISDFYNMITEEADKHRDSTWSILKERTIVHLWIVLPGDDVKLINATADALTQGTRSRVDIDKIAEMIDRPDQEAIYIREWKTRRGQLGHLLRSVDLRLIGLPPNAALSAIRSFGEESVKGKLKQPSADLETSKTAMRSTRLYKAILSEIGREESYAGPRRLSDETINEFIRVQTVASRDDKPLNKALGSLLAACLADDAPNVRVTTEKRSLLNSSLQPDIQIEIRDGEFICLEPTWRTSGAGIAHEVKEAQNTLSEAHVKKYLLDKATQYVKDMGL